MDAIAKRRSIRRFADETLSREQLEAVLQAATLAPSGKNRQPWRFVVVTGSAREGMLAAMQEGLAREEAGVQAQLPAYRQFLPAARNTLRIMEKAPATIFVLNPLGRAETLPASFEEQCYELCNVQSVGAAIQNMLLVALDLGLGGLWNCDVDFACAELCRWLDTEEQLVAAVCLGVPAEAPGPTARRPLADVVEWRD